MFTSLQNVNILRKLGAVHNPVTCLSVRSLRITSLLKQVEPRISETIFLKTNPEVPIIAVTDKDNVDIIGPPDSVSNLRPIVRRRCLQETPLQRYLRELQDETQEWNQKFWVEHNTKFIQRRQDFIKVHKATIAENRAPTADEMSEFYKKFLDENWQIHGEPRKFIWNFIAGPKLAKPYEPGFGRLSQALFTHLPASASNIKLFDEIGNNSKSVVLYGDDYLTLYFESRYPLLKAWKTKYTIQYNVPIYEYLRKKSENVYLLKMRIVDHVLNDAVIRQVRTNVIIPQDSEIIDVSTHDSVKRRKDERSETALSFNRPTIVFTAENLPDTFVPEFVITYTTPACALFKPALIISIYIEVVFISCVAYRRIGSYF